MHMNLQILSIPESTGDLDDQVQGLLKSARLEYEIVDGKLDSLFNENPDQK